MKRPASYACVLGLALSTAYAAPAAESTPNPEAAVALVRSMYAQFPFESSSIVAAEPAVIARYFDAELIALLEADAECTRVHEGVCNLDGDPIYNAQDAEITDLSVSPGTRPTEVLVRFANFGQAQELRYDVVQTSAGVRVHDIHYADGNSLRGWLSTPIE